MIGLSIDSIHSHIAWLRTIKEKIEFNGKRFAPLYTPRNATLISLFGITDEEQSLLGTIISKDMAAERHRKRDETRRRAAGEVDRQTYLATAETKKAQALALRVQGLTVRAIAAQIGASVGAVVGYLKAAGS